MKTTLYLFIIVISIAMVSCGGDSKSPAEKYITKDLPDGVSVYGFNEKFDKPYGKYELHFFVKNETGKKIEFPEIEGALYLDGKLEGPVTGGPGKHLDNLDSGVVSFAYILPTKVPDSVVFSMAQ